MAQIQISLSQGAIDAARLLAQVTQAPANGLVGALFDTLVSVGSTVARSYVDFSKATLQGDTLTLEFPDQATIVYRKLVFADPSARVGLVQSSQFDFSREGTLNFSQSGNFALAYQFDTTASGSSSMELASLGGTAQSARLESDYAEDSPRYNPYLGNVGMSMVGTVGSDAAGKIYGAVTTLEQWADKLFKSVRISGDLKLSGDHAAVSAGTGHVAVAGTVAAYEKEYYDGSFERYSAMEMKLGTAEQFDLNMLALAASFPGDDTIQVSLPATVYNTVKVASGAGNDRVTLIGGGSMLHGDGGAGNDRFFAGAGSHVIDGGAGVDTVQYVGLRADTALSRSGTTFLVTKPGQSGTDITRNFERFEWTDKGLAFDIDGVAGKAYRVYQAAFDRKPDIEGLSFWMHQMDKGAALYDVAAGFVASAEFRTLYGEAPSDSAFLTRLYQNVLHRAYDQAGFDFWLSALVHGTSRPVVLAQFSESPENQAQVIGAIQNGIDFLPLATAQIVA
jgi:hypothetical protein